MAGPAWPRAAHCTSAARQPARGQEKREKTRKQERQHTRGAKNRQRQERTREKNPYAERCTGQHRLGRVVDGDD